MVATRQLSLAGGEIAPALYGRIDTAKYETGLRTLRNCIVMRHGGVQNRPGTRFIVEVKDSTQKVKLIPFVFSNTQTYVLEFGDQYVRVMKDGAQLTLTSAVADWIPANNYVVGDLVEDPGGSGIFYYCILAHLSNGNQPPNATFWFPIPTSAFEFPTPYLEAELPDLKFVQSADVLTLVHPNHPPRDLARTGDTEWTLTQIVFAPDIDPPTDLAVAGTPGPNSFTYHVTSHATSNFEESLAVVAVQGSLQDPTTSNPHTITWTEEPLAQEYSIYLVTNGVPGFIGTAQGASFVNNGIIPDTTDQPPIANDPFPGVDDFPSTVTYFQQRLVFANTNNRPERVFASRVGNFHNFARSTPLQDDDSVTFDLIGRKVNAIRHLIELGTLVVFTEDGEWAILGDEAGILTPSEVNAKQHSYNGASTVPPLIIDATSLFVQARGSKVRDLGFQFEVDGYRGTELSIFAAHLVDKFSIVEWDFQQVPHSVVWAVRSDGKIIGLTYLRDHQIAGWHVHDTAGLFENVVVVPETAPDGNSNEDAVYVVVQRTIDGSSVRYIERFATRQVDEDAVEDSVFMDSSLSLDGTNTTAITMTLTSPGPPFDAGENLTLTASAAFFVAGDVGNKIYLNLGTVTIKCLITAFTSSTVVTVQPNKDVPVAFQSVAILTWGHAVDTLSNLDHLEGENVSVFGDGFVDASPNNEAATIITVSGGSITLSEPRVVVHVGLPYLSDIETLDVDTTQGQSLADKEINIQEVVLIVEETRGIWAGPQPPTDDADDPLEGLQEAKLRDEESSEDPPALVTDKVDIPMDSEWNRNGRIFLRQVDPIPMAILSVLSAGYIPFRR